MDTWFDKVLMVCFSAFAGSGTLLILAVTYKILTGEVS